MNTITFSTADFPEVSGCEVGKEETLSVTITPTKIVGGQVTADVTGIEYVGAQDEGVAEEEGPPVRPGKGPPRAIVAIGIPGRGSKGY